MAEVPIYRSQAAAPNIGSISIAPVQVPDLHSGEGLSEGMKEFGAALVKYAAFKKNADDTVRTNTAMTGFITGIDQAETEAAQSPNYETVPQDFHKKAEELSQKALADANLDPAERSALELRLKTYSIGAGGRVNAGALGKQVDAASATRGQQALALSRAAAAASSDVERKAYVEQHLSTIDKNVRAGLLSADKGEAEKQAFTKSVDDQYIRQLIRTDPIRAQKELGDVTRWKGMSGSEIETYRNQAETAADAYQKDHILGLAGGSHPEQASMAVNKALSRRDATAIYDGGVIHVEHGAVPAYIGAGTAGGGGRLKSAPAGTKPLAANDPRLAPVRYAGGTFMVDARYQKNFQGFISDYEAAGGVIGPNSGTIGARPNNASYHPIAAAIDINQTGRGVRSGGKTLPLELEDKLAAKWGLRSGNHFRNNDNGHFDAGGSGGGDGGVLPGGKTFDVAKASLEVSEGGAIGLGQIMPDTAREVAGKLNVLTADGKRVSQMSNAEITDYLRQNPEVNRKLGLDYWLDALDAFDQNVALAAAGYNAGIGRAKQYQAAVIAKYGADATPLQIAEVIGEGSEGLKPNKETHDYILKLFGKLGVAPTGPGVSAGNRRTTETAVQTVIDKQQTEADRIIKEQAAMDRATLGTDTLNAAKGVAAWTPETDAVLQRNIQAAAAGSAEAAAFVQSAKVADEAKPHTAAAWQMTPSRLDNEITRLQAREAVGATHAEIVQLASYKAVQSEIGANAKTDPVGLGNRAGLYKAEALDPNAAPDDPGFLRSLAVRGLQATRAEAVYSSLAPLRPKEVDALKQRFAEADVPEKLALLNAFAQTLGDRGYRAALDQLGLDPATATAGRFAPEDPALAKKILIGDTYKKVPGAEKAGTALTAAANEAIGGNVYPPGSPALADTLAAVENVYLANRGPDALFKPADVPAMKAAVTEVLGELVSIGGRKVPATPGISASRFEELFDNLNDEQLAAMRPVLPRFTGNDEVVDQAGRPIPAEELTSHAVLIQKVPRGSQYYVTDALGNRYFRQDHTPLILDFKYLDAHVASDEAAAAAARVQASRDDGIPMNDPAAPGPGVDLFALPEQQVIPPAEAPAIAAPPAPSPDEGRSRIPSLTPGVPGEYGR